MLERSAKLVLAGSLVVVLDFEINGFDLINDVIGFGLVVGGLWRLQTADLAARWATLALAAAVVWLLVTVVTEVVVISGPLSWLGGISGAAATVLGVLAFQDGCRHLSFDKAVSSWSTSLRLVVSIWGGLVMLGLVVMAVTGRREFHYEGPWAIPVVVLAFVPVVHLLISLGRTASEAKRSSQSVPAM